MEKKPKQVVNFKLRKIPKMEVSKHRMPDSPKLNMKTEEKDVSERLAPMKGQKENKGLKIKLKMKKIFKEGVKDSEDLINAYSERHKAGVDLVRSKERYKDLTGKESDKYSTIKEEVKELNRYNSEARKEIKNKKEKKLRIKNLK